MMDKKSKRAKHTPGPWVLVGKTEIRARFYDYDIDRTYHDLHVTDLTHGDRDRKTRIANARLIAASPCMLDALRLCLSFLKSVKPYGAFDRLVLKAVENAISTAEGLPKTDKGTE